MELFPILFFPDLFSQFGINVTIISRPQFKTLTTNFTLYFSLFVQNLVKLIF